MRKGLYCTKSLTGWPAGFALTMPSAFEVSFGPPASPHQLLRKSALAGLVPRCTTARVLVSKAEPLTAAIEPLLISTPRAEPKKPTPDMPAEPPATRTPALVWFSRSPPVSVKLLPLLIRTPSDALSTTLKSVRLTDGPSRLNAPLLASRPA